MSRGLLYIIFCCAALVPLHAGAVWEYSLAAKLGIYDAVEKLCRPVYPAAFEGRTAEKGLQLDPEERSQINTVRQSREYQEVLNEASEELEERIAAAGKDGATKVCKEVIDWN